MKPYPFSLPPLLLLPPKAGSYIQNFAKYDIVVSNFYFLNVQTSVGEGVKGSEVVTKLSLDKERKFNLRSRWDHGVKTHENQVTFWCQHDKCL